MLSSPGIYIRRFATLLPKSEKTSTRGRYGIPIHAPSSLDALKLQPSDFWDFSLHKTPCRPQNVSRELSPAKLVYPLRQAFPEGTQGFLYYHLPPNPLPQTAGQVRIRVVQGGAKDPTTSFERSTDLLAPTGRPWSIPYWKLTGNSSDAESLAPIRESLIASGLIDQDTLDKSRHMFTPEIIHDVKAGHSHILHSMNEPFCMRFGTRRKLKLWLVDPRGEGFTSVWVNSHDLELPDSLKEVIVEPEHLKRLWAHVQIEYDAAKFRFATRIIAAYDTTEKIIHESPGERSPIRFLKTDSPEGKDPYEALLSFVPKISQREIKLTQEQASHETERRYSLSTLKPAFLRVSDFQDLSSLIKRKLSLNDKHTVTARYFYDSVKKEHLPFPPNSRGYFYYYEYPSSTGYTPSANEVRFRCVPAATAVPFEDWKQGTDLLRRNGLPWSITFHEIALAPGMEVIRHILIQDGLVSPDQFTRYREVVSVTRLTQRKLLVVSFGVGYPFAVRFYQKTSTVWLVTENEVQPLKIKTGFLHPFDKSRREGFTRRHENAALICLEADKRGVYARILRVPPAFGAKMRYKVGQKVRLGFKEMANSPGIQLLSRMLGKSIIHTPRKKT